MKTAKNYKFWFATGSQDLYGDECLQKVAEHSKIIVNELNKSGILPYEVVWKPTLITNEVIRKTFNDANADEECAGVITWMHTFSRQNPGFWDCRNTGNHCCICIRSSMKKFHTIRLIWTL